MTLAEQVTSYCRETRRLDGLPSTTEPTFYPEVKTLLTAVLREGNLPFEARTNTSEVGAAGRDMPDFVLGDGGAFVGVYGEVKRPDVSLQDLAVSTEMNDQIGRYLAKTGVVLLSNVRGFGMLTSDPAFIRDPATPVPPNRRVLGGIVDLWLATGPGATSAALAAASSELASIVATAVTDHARIATPADLARVLARQARDAKAALPENLDPVRPLVDDYRSALGLAFDLDDEKGERFFRSSLVQSVFYALFAAWILWDRAAPVGDEFEVDDAHTYLPIPFLDALLHDIRHPARMRHLGLEPHFRRAIRTLNRVDRPTFRVRMTFPTLDGEDTTAAITYFYEPFLEAFDPQLREELGVWYTPPEVVRYQVRRVHQLLKTELGRPRGLADPEVVVLDPCCGTGAYLLEVARCIADELRAEGDEATLGLELSRAFRERVIGFEILTAPFAIAQLQVHLALKRLGAEPQPGTRPAVFLTNALTGWTDGVQVRLSFPEMRDEFDASQGAKRGSRVIVVVGNPPYDRFAGVAQAEEAELVAHYKGITLAEELGPGGAPRLDEFGRPKKKQRGTSALYEEFGVRKQLLDDLYVRFIRLAEERIGQAAEYGVVSFISNSSYLTGRSHPLMRRSLLGSFHAVWIDNLNGDKYRTGKIIPQGLPGAGTRDDSVFTTEADQRGIQPGTAIVTWVKRLAAPTPAADTSVWYRDFWGPAASKRSRLLNSLPNGREGAGPEYIELRPSAANRWRLGPQTAEGGFEAWPALDELFPVTVQGVNHNRGIEGGCIDPDRSRLESRMRAYLAASDFHQARQTCPVMATPRSRYDPEEVWELMREDGHFRDEALRRFLVFPLDPQFIYYERRHKWLNEARPEFERNASDNEWLITVPEPRKVSEALPLFATEMVNLHVHERGSVAFPRETQGEGLLQDRDANLTEPVWRALRQFYGLTGDRRDSDARALVGQLFRVALGTMHAPSYQAEHKSALSADWAHLPLPRDRDLLADLTAAGAKVARLLDAHADARAVISEVLGPQRSRQLATLRRTDGGQLRSEDTRVEVTYWGGGRGRWASRAFDEDEKPATEWAITWGEATGDLYINNRAFFAHVPERVWRYQLGGYPVLKKWLGYRQASRREGAPLSDEERRWFRQMVQRIAALLALGPELDSLYQKASANALTVAELGIAR